MPANSNRIIQSFILNEKQVLTRDRLFSGLHRTIWKPLVMKNWFKDRKKHNVLHDLLWILIILKLKWRLKLASTIFYQVFIFSQNDSPPKAMKNVFFSHLKSSSLSQDIQFFFSFSFPFHTFQIQKGKWKWNNLWCHGLTCINLQMQYLE